MAILNRAEVTVVVDDQALVEYKHDWREQKRPKRTADWNIPGSTGITGNHVTAPKTTSLEHQQTRPQLRSTLQGPRQIPGSALIPLTNVLPVPEENIRPKKKAWKSTTRSLIKATCGKQFSLRFSSNEGFSPRPRFMGVKVVVMLDGVVTDAQCFTEKLFNGTSIGRVEIRDTTTSIQPYQFADIITDSDSRPSKEALKALEKEHYQLGVIRVGLWRLKDIRDAEDSDSDDLCSAQLKHSADKSKVVIPETAMKGSLASYRTGFSEPQQVEHLPEVAVQFLDKYRPYLVLEFKCVSKTTLQALDFLPRVPAPPPILIEDDEDLNEQQLRQRLKEMQRIDTLERIKSEFESDGRIPTVIKHEADEDLSIVQAKRAQRPLEHGDTMDLTED